MVTFQSAKVLLDECSPRTTVFNAYKVFKVEKFKALSLLLFNCQNMMAK